MLTSEDNTVHCSQSPPPFFSPICGFSTLRFIGYCVNEGGYNGFDFTDAEGEDEVAARLANLRICSDGESQCYHETII